MRYAEFLERGRFNKEELLGVAKANLLEDGPPEMPRLPAPPFLMFDRITELTRKGNGGRIVAEQDITPDAWFFTCHFQGDPVQPGCLGLDAVWQLLGFFCAASGGVGSGRALGVGEIEFFGQIRPYDLLVTYDITVRRFTQLKGSGAAVAIGDAEVRVDGTPIYTIKGARVGTFTGIAYSDYPNSQSKMARGGIIDRSKQ